MVNIFLQLQGDSIPKPISNSDSTSFSIWLWIAIFEFAIISFLFLRLRKKEKKLKFADLSKDKMRYAKKLDVDMDDLMNSISGSKNLYKELSRTCHPDRFINTDKQKIAEEIFQDISKYKRDFKKLSELKQRAITELNIKLK